MKSLFLTLAILGTIVPYVSLWPWLLEHGLDLPLLISEMFTTDVSRFFSLDVIVSALVVFVMVGRGTKQGVAHAWLAVLGTLSVGVSLGLPLYLYLEARHKEKRTAMTYIDGFVAAVPTVNREKYKGHVEYSAAVFKDHGATRVVECWGQHVPDGEVTSFSKAVQKKDGETVCFSWIVWPSKEARDVGMEKVFADERMKPENNPMPFDGKRLIYGGFEVLVEV